MISVIIPHANPNNSLNRICESLAAVSSPIEVILVVSKDLKGKIPQEYPIEEIIVSEHPGRGYACVRGLELARGEIIIFLHADTILPQNWDKLIINALSRKNVVGGAFSLTFDTNHQYLKLLILLSDLFFKVYRELWGDRAIFVRAKILKEHASIMDVPIMEDVKLSAFIKKRGKVLMLKEKVITSSETFIKYGLLRHTFRIIKARLWYALGGNLEKIYSYYYS